MYIFGFRLFMQINLYNQKKKKTIYLRDKLYQDFKGIYLRQKINIDRYTNKIIE